jgi:hypothetical protein
MAINRVSRQSGSACPDIVVADIRAVDVNTKLNNNSIVAVGVY